MREFQSIRAFTNHLRALAAATPAVTAHIADQVGELVEQRAKDEIGHYQAAAGPFAAWAQLSPITEAHKAAMGYPADAPLLATGEMRESIAHTVATRMLGATVTVGSTDKKMVFHEFGTDRMPPRPVLGPAMYTAKHDIERIAAATMFAFLSGRAWKKEKHGGSI